MNFKEELEKARKEKLGLDKVDTKKVFDDILKYYKEKVIDAPREVMGYSIDIAISNMNNFNKLGGLEYLYEEWGDNYFVDMKNSAFLEMTVNDDGNTEGDEQITFSDIDELKEVANISFSLVELINLCKEYNIRIRIYAKSDYDYMTSLEISPYESYNQNEDSIRTYLNTVKK